MDENELIDIPQDLVGTMKLIYTPMNLKYSKPIKEVESEEYGAYSFQLKEWFVKFRIAKTTPTKVGKFVTLWKRDGKGLIQPYDLNDPFRFFCY